MEQHQPGRVATYAARFISKESLPYRLLFGPDPYHVRPKAILMIALLVVLNVVVWVVSVIVYRPYPSMIGTATIAYTLGLRHAMDADHITAIDNVTRKLLADNQHPVAVGFFFSLGHSTIVFITSIIVAATAAAVANGVEDFSAIGGVIGTSIAIVFLSLIAVLNIIILVGVIRVLKRVKREGVYTELNIEEYLSQRGFLGRFFRPVFRFINASWKMYPLGLLFGLGFDTSTEITLLGITAIQGASGMSMWLIILLPLLFVAGMSLIDTLDGMLMLFTYTWAYVNPVRKLYYNVIITTISVVMAVLVALIQLFSLVGEECELDNGWWRFWATLSNSFEWIGIAIVGAFIITWIISSILYRYYGYKDLEQQFDEHNANLTSSKTLEAARAEGKDGESKTPETKSDFIEVIVAGQSKTEGDIPTPSEKKETKPCE